jgi:LAO/AO transport system kinase
VRRLSIEAYEAGVLAGDRAILARAITLVESEASADVPLARALLSRLLPHTGRARRIGVTGVPGVGKSTFIDAFGMFLIQRGLTVAVLAVDPSSQLSGGSILGDKTRMARLAFAPGAFVRPSPSGFSSGGVAHRTRESMLVCEAAGFDVVLVETVGVGQAETAVEKMVDTFLLLALPGSGDELQGIKKGVLELADVVAVNKADGEGERAARLALADLAAALRYVPRKRAGWASPALAISGATGLGLESLWEKLEAHHHFLQTGEVLTALRAEQQVAWFWQYLREGLEATFRSHPQVIHQLATVEAQVRTGQLMPGAAAERLLSTYAKK